MTRLAVISLLCFWTVGGTLVIWALHAAPAPIPAKPAWMLDPQGHDKNHDALHCEPGTQPYYVYADDNTSFFEECMR